MFCSQCGKKNPDSAKYCYNCGTLIVIPEKASTSTPSVSTSNSTLKKIESEKPERKTKHHKRITSPFIVQDDDDYDEYDDYGDDDYDEYDAKYNHKKSSKRKKRNGCLASFLIFVITTLIIFIFGFILIVRPKEPQVIVPVPSATPNPVPIIETEMPSVDSSSFETSASRSSGNTSGHSSAYNSLTAADKKEICEIIEAAYAIADSREGQYSGDKYSESIWQEIENEYHITESEVTQIWMNSK